jgi:lysophospholipase L1-like esterase
MRAVLARAVLLLVGLAVGVAIVDLSVRVMMDLFACHDRLGWTFAPDKSGWKTSRSREYLLRERFNSFGLRDIDRPLEKPDGVFRILFLGDSTVASMQVAREDSYPGLLEELLSAEAGAGKVEVINAGIDGYGTAQSLLMFHEYGSRVDPDLVVLGVYLANDVADNWAGNQGTHHYLARRCGRPYFELQNDTLVAVNGGVPLIKEPSFFDRLLRLSILYSNFIPNAARGGVEPDFDGSQVFTVPPPDGVDDALELTGQLLSQLNDEVAEQGARLVVLFTPEKMEIGQRAVPDRPARVYGPAYARIERHLESDGIPYIDLVPRLTQHIEEGGALPYFERDDHFNEVGHLISVELIRDWLALHCSDVAPGLPGCRAPTRDPSNS